MLRVIEYGRQCSTQWLALLTVAVLLGWAGTAGAQQPSRVNPTESSVNEKQLLDALKPGGETTVHGRISIPDSRAGNLIQPGGQDWRSWRDTTLPRIGLGLIVGMVALLAVFPVVRGRVRVEGGLSGKTIERFNGIERFGHWLVATSFVVLALSGLNVTYGRQFLLPLVGPEQFTDIAQVAKYMHNYMSFAFVLGLVMIFFMWVIFNLPSLRDVRWIAQGGGLVGSKHPPAGRFNAGQKLIFWTVILGGASLTLTGYMLMFPFYQPPVGLPGGLSTASIDGLQTAEMLHGIIAVVMIAVILAHVYIGTVGMQGAFWAMGTGKVDTNWARQHHSVWAERLVDKVGATKPAPGE